MNRPHECQNCTKNVQNHQKYIDFIKVLDNFVKPSL